MDTPNPSAQPFLTESPVLGSSMDSLHLLFGAPELEAMQRFNAAEAVVEAWAIQDGRTAEENEVLDATTFERAWALDFVQARLERLIPDRVDVIRWVFDVNTFEQAQATAKMRYAETG